MRSLFLCGAIALSILSLPGISKSQENDSSTLVEMPSGVLTSPNQGDSELDKPHSISEKLSAAFTLKNNTRVKISPRSLILPATLIGVGTACLVNNDLRRVNELTKGKIYKEGYEEKMKIDDYTMVAPALAVYALNFSGVKGKHNFIDRTLILTMSNLICNGIVFTTKSYTGIQRPDQSDLFSFPSGHTASAFVSAEFMRLEYKDVSPWYGVVGYAFAAGTGVLRMYHNKHWLNDVVAGAGAGILATRISYWAYPRIKSLFPGLRGKVMAAPTYRDGAYGVTMVYGLP